jgi:uncharacterized protein (TIGR02996 family)
MSEADFLAAIREEPEDDATRLVYADWLDDHGDPRAEYLRVEHAVRVLRAPQHDRLTVLRSQLDRAWLRAVHDGLLGPDWAIVLQAYHLEHRPTLLQALREVLGLPPEEAEAPALSCPREIARDLLYRQAHRLRQGLQAWGLVTVEFRPSPPT